MSGCSILGSGGAQVDVIYAWSGAPPYGASTRIILTYLWVCVVERTPQHIRLARAKIRGEIRFNICLRVSYCSMADKNVQCRRGSGDELSHLGSDSGRAPGGAYLNTSGS